jgi:hypothetical protein
MMRSESSGGLGDIARNAPLLNFPPVPPPPIKGAWFKHQTIYVDGHTFEDCRFDACQLVTEFATFNFQRCFISPDCRLYFRGPALKTVRLLMHMLKLHGRISELSDESSVYATVNKDGTFTLE